jgi:hypothetical protein
MNEFDKIVNQILNEKTRRYSPSLKSINLSDPPEVIKNKVQNELKTVWNFTEGEIAQYFQQLGNNGFNSLMNMNIVFLKMLENKRQPNQQKPYWSVN